MVITTKYRDIPRSEAVKCYKGGKVPGGLGSVGTWENMRGRRVLIETPATMDHHPSVICGGPFYRLAEHPEFIACPHIAEIGD